MANSCGLPLDSNVVYFLHLDLSLFSHSPHWGASNNVTQKKEGKLGMGENWASSESGDIGLCDKNGLGRQKGS